MPTTAAAILQKVEERTGWLVFGKEEQGISSGALRWQTLFLADAELDQEGFDESEAVLEARLVECDLQKSCLYRANIGFR